MKRITKIIYVHEDGEITVLDIPVHPSTPVQPTNQPGWTPRPDFTNIPTGPIKR